MWNLSTPPVPPTASREVLLELAAYYRQLTEYHQRSAAIAAQQLAHVEVLLKSNLMVDRDWNVNEQSLLGRLNGNRGVTSSMTSLPEVPPAPLEATIASISTETPQKEEVFNEEKARQAIAQLLIDNRTKILRLDYIVQKLYGHLNILPADKEILQDKVRNILKTGEDQRFWSAVPDSPDCWTIDLQDIPDLAKTNTKGKQKFASANSGNSDIGQKAKKSTKKMQLRSRLFYSEKLENTSLVDAVAQCLHENYPKTMSANEVVRWLYPDGLPEEDRKQARSSVSDTLNKRCDSKGWKRVSIGEYIWDTSQ
jgi:hypothetical protein